MIDIAYTLYLHWDWLWSHANQALLVSAMLLLLFLSIHYTQFKQISIWLQQSTKIPNSLSVYAAVLGLKLLDSYLCLLYQNYIFVGPCMHGLCAACTVGQVYLEVFSLQISLMMSLLKWRHYMQFLIVSRIV